MTVQYHWLIQMQKSVNIRKMNSTMHKYLPWSSWIHSSVTRMNPHIQINVIHHINKRKEKVPDNLTRCRKNIWKNSTSIQIKSLTSVGIEGTNLNIIQAIFEKLSQYHTWSLKAEKKSLLNLEKTWKCCLFSPIHLIQYWKSLPQQ